MHHRATSSNTFFFEKRTQKLITFVHSLWLCTYDINGIFFNFYDSKIPIMFCYFNKNKSLVVVIFYN